MKLTELFINNRQVIDTGKNQSVSAFPNTLVNRQIQALVPGQTIHGEVLGRNGNEVQVRLAEDLIINARVDQGMQLELGKSLFFEVRNNGSTLTLSPLFANTATETNVLKALDMAGLPVNTNTVKLTVSMMEAGLSIDRSSIQQLFREMNSFPKVSPTDIVDLHKLQIPVTENNLKQIASYKNLTHQLTEGINQVLSELSETLQSIVNEGNEVGAASLYTRLLDLVLKENGTTESQLTGMEQGLQGDGVLDNRVQGIAPFGIEAPDIDGTDGVGKVIQGAEEQGIELQGTKEQTIELQGTDGQAKALQGQDIQSMGKSAPELQSGYEQAGENRAATVSGNLEAAILAKPDSFAQNAEFIINTLQKAVKEDDSRLLKAVLENKVLKKFLGDNIRNQWLLRPEEVEEGKVEELYQRLNRQLKGISNALEHAGQTSQTSYHSVTSLSQNIDFLHQFNQMYTYVQLPLKLQDGQANGDLYVYTNKKNLAYKDGQVSALLHLDMEHLGPLDVYVAMSAQKVNTKFYVQDEAMLDFLEAHMNLLTQRLNQRGYTCNLDMQVRKDTEEVNSGIRPILEKQGNIPLVQYAFDMRA